MTATAAIDVAALEAVLDLVPPPEDDFLLPEDFWTARPAWDQVRQAARSRLVPPDALCGAVLARVAQFADFRFWLPAIVGRQGSLNIIVGTVGPSGAGKGSVCDESRALLGEPETARDFRVGEAPAGSGEGMVRAFFDVQRDPDDRRRTVVVRSRESVLFRIDEGEVLRQLGARTGQTTMQVLRQMFSGEALGNSYVGDSRQLQLAPHGYRASVLMAIQPELARFLLADAVGGTPQRILWLAAVDPSIPALVDIPEHPGPIAWTPPTFVETAVQAKARLGPDGLRRVEMTVAASIGDQLRRARHSEVASSDIDADPLDGHRGLMQLKVAALLAIFDGRLDVDEDDWGLAGIISDTSRAVRRWVQRTLIDADRRRDFASNERAAARAARVETAKLAAVDRVDRVAAVLARKVSRLAEPASRRSLRDAVASRDRDEFDAGLGRAVARGWIQESALGFEVGAVPCP